MRGRSRGIHSLTGMPGQLIRLDARRAASMDFQIGKWICLKQRRAHPPIDIIREGDCAIRP